MPWVHRSCLNQEDLVLWEQVYPDATPDRYHSDGDVFEVGGAALKAIHTPGPLAGIHLLLPGERGDRVHR